MQAAIDAPAVQTVSFREAASPAELCRSVLDAGFKRVELWSRHLERWPDLPVRMGDCGLRPVGLGIARLGDPSGDARWFDTARAIGAAYLTADFDASAFPAQVEDTAALARAAGIAIAIHNHGAPHWLGNVRMLTRFLADAPPEFGLCLDTAWALDSREDPAAMIRTFAPRLRAVHLKDFAFDCGRNPREVLPGDGGLRLREIQQALREAAFAGELVIETEAPDLSPADARARWVAAVEATS